MHVNRGLGRRKNAPCIQNGDIIRGLVIREQYSQ
jgi:hypothetical protein